MAGFVEGALRQDVVIPNGVSFTSGVQKTVFLGRKTAFGKRDNPAKDQGFATVSMVARIREAIW